MIKNSKYVGVKTLEVLEGADNYNQWISDQIFKYAKAPIMEFGAGTGNISKHFIKITPFQITEYDSVLVKDLAKRFKKYKNIKVSKLDITKEPPKDYINHFETIYGVNVLEHIESDKKALINLRKILTKNGKLILLVPAKEKAFTKLDKKLGHFRRYEKNGLIKLLEESEYHVEKIYYFNFIGIFAWKIRDIIDSDDDLKSTQIRLFDLIVPFLKIVESVIKPPVGVSLIIVARK